MSLSITRKTVSITVNQDSSRAIDLADLARQAGLTVSGALSLQWLGATANGSPAPAGQLIQKVDADTVNLTPSDWKGWNGTYYPYVGFKDASGQLFEVAITTTVAPVSDTPKTEIVRQSLSLTVEEDSSSSYSLYDLARQAGFNPDGALKVLWSGAYANGQSVPSGQLLQVGSTGDIILSPSDLPNFNGKYYPYIGFTDATGQKYELKLNVTVTDIPEDSSPKPQASIGDTVWLDGNGNGVQDAGEAGVAGVAVKLLSTGGATLATTTTDANGKYQFDVAAGSYLVEVTAPTGLGFTGRDLGGNDVTDSDVNSSGRSGTITVVAGQVMCDVDAGLVKVIPAAKASLGDRVWLDANRNGLQDSGETGLGGVTVQLRDSSGNLVRSTTTDAQGNYLFDQLDAGSYAVTVVKPAGYDFTSRDVLSNGADAIDSDVSTSTGSTGMIALDSGQAIRTVDAGLVVKAVAPTASVGDRVWLDANKNGLQDAGEAGVAGVAVQLKNAAGAVIATTTTNTQGDYLFDSLAAGTYQVGITAPSQYELTAKDAFGNGADGIDSDFNAANGHTDTFALADGQAIRTVDAGLVLKPVAPTASVGDRVWLDANKNGLQDAGEAGVAGVAVQLKNAAGAVIATTTTNTQGDYLFSSLAAGTYQVGITAPSQYELTAKDAFGNGADVIDSDFNVANGHTDTFTLADGQAIRTVDAGLVQKVVEPVRTASIGDTVWEDANFNGFQDLGEQGIANVTVRLTDTNGAVVGTTTTDANGRYLFDKLAAGEYKVQVQGPNGYFVTKSNIGSNDAADSDIGADGVTGVIRLNEGQKITDVDAGLYRKASVGDHVWLDGPQFNADGIQNDNGTGSDVDPNLVPTNVTIRLYREDGTLVATTVSDAKGDYKFTGVDPGRYYIDFDNSTNPRAFSLGIKWSPANQGADDTKDSDAIAYGPLVSYGSWGVVGTMHAKTDVFELTSGQHDGTRDAGIQASPIVLDLNADGKISVTGQTSSIDKSGITEIGRTVRFDIDADGTLDNVEWITGGGDGVLVDMSKIGANGEIDGSALFGDEGGKYANGYEKLALHDRDNDGHIAGDELGRLGLWIDDGDAVLEAGELLTAAQAGLSSVSATMSINFDDAGRELMQSTAEVNGQSVMTEDVWFAKSQVSVPSLSELVGGDSLDALVGSAAPAAASSGAAAMHPADGLVSAGEAADMMRRIIDMQSLQPMSA